MEHISLGSELRMRYVISLGEDVASVDYDHCILGCVEVGWMVGLWNISFRILGVIGYFLVYCSLD